MFTREKLDKLEPLVIFASGLDFDEEGGINMWSTHELLRWVAVRGEVDDWAVYVDKADKSVESVKDFGCKIFKDQAVKLINGSQDFYDRYRT